ncbi:MAG: flagellar hook-length control protein FliK, partial [Lachnospiraceae bacterium]|nr:flagellar hook-length control protein FliK [Lachnospiraceae bacterium]
ELTDLVRDLSADLTAELSDVANELGMSLEELTDEIARQAALADGFEDAGQGEIVLESISGEKFSAEMVEDTDDQDIQILSADEASAQTSVVKENTQAEHTGKGSGNGNGEKQNKSEGQQAEVAAPAAQAPVDQTALRNAETPVERFEQTLSSKQTQEVIDQIAEHARISGGDKMTSMEMMLNPANLGSIRLILQSDNGMVRGQLQASDDAVRAALESQLQQLRDALVEQGVKVEALEVTVAGHQLEQNLDQSGEQAEKEAERVAALKNPRRILDLNEIGEEEEAAEEMTQAEKLEIEMMRMGGNRMSYQV